MISQIMRVLRYLFLVIVLGFLMTWLVVNPFRADAMVKEAIILSNDGRLLESIMLLKKATKVDPFNGKAFELCGALYSRIHESKISLESSFVTLANTFFNAQIQVSTPPDSLIDSLTRSNEYLVKSLRLRRNYDVYRILARNHLVIDQPMKAKKYADHYLYYYPKDPKKDYNLIRCSYSRAGNELYRMGRKDHALTIFQQGAKLPGWDAECELAIASHHLAIGQMDNARLALAKAEKAHNIKDHPDTYAYTLYLKAMLARASEDLSGYEKNIIKAANVARDNIVFQYLHSQLQDLN